MHNKLPKDFIIESEKAVKVGLLGTVTPDNMPHISLISSIQAKGDESLIFGQFIEGMSKTNIKTNPKIGFLVMSMKREYWTGKTNWVEAKTEGEDFIMFNAKPLFRYNSYCGIHTVHLMKLININEKKVISIPKTVTDILRTSLSKPFIKTESSSILKPLSQKLLNTSENPKFIAYIDDQGFPVINPVIHATSKNSNIILFSKPSNDEFWQNLKSGAQICIFALSLEMENVLVNGTFRGFQTTLTGKTGVLEIERIYNSMPPKMGYIYPDEKLLPVSDF